MKDKKILFSNINWLENYNGISEDNTLDKYNFYNYHGEAFGYVQLLEYDSKNQEWKRSPAEKIETHRIDKTSNDRVDDVLLVWIGIDPKDDEYKIIGWYENATIFKETQIYYNEVFDEKIEYRFRSSFDHIHLLKEKNRVFKVPDKNKNISGMDKSNVWYIDTKKDENEEKYKFENEFKKKVINYINKVGDYLMIDRKELSELEEEMLMKKRITNGDFRDKLIKEDPKCKLCGLEEEELLIASHIKPWDESTEDERVDVENGILLCPNHEYLFANYLMSFSNNGNVMIANELDDRARVMVNVFGDLSIEMTNKQKDYMEYHRNIFLEDKK